MSFCQSVSPSRYLSTLAYRITVVLGIVLLMSHQSQAVQSGSGPISDFMIMNLCLHPDGSVDQGVLPGSADCKSQRDIAVGEQPPYVLQNFSNPRASCKGGSIIKVNIPVTKGKNTRITSSTIRTSCGPVGTADEAALSDDNGVSVQWYDGGYGFIMGSYSPVALSSFESDLCAQNRNSSERFFRGWVIAPAIVPAAGARGLGVFPSKLHTGRPSDVPDACAARYNRGLTAWAVDNFTFKSARRLLSIISSHYSRSDEAGNGPGKAMQMEQTYWTREFGLSRWEKWAREDWVHPRTKQGAIYLARKMAAAGRCSPPDLGAKTYSKAMQLSAAAEDADGFTRVLVNPQTGEKHTWYMTLCEDYTNTAPSGSTGYVSLMQKMADDTYWR